SWHGLQLVNCAGDFGNIPLAGAPTRSSDSDNWPLRDSGGCVRPPLHEPPGARSYLVAGSNDGARVAVVWSGPKGIVFAVYDAKSGKSIAILPRDIGSTWVLVASPDSSRFATGGEDGIVRLWETATGKLIALCLGHERKVLGLAFRH